jgi:prepilin-type N-terminal cleavage/methylation domain-containing protein
MKPSVRNLPRPDRRGVTLVEMMIAVSAFAVVMGAVMGFVVQQRRSYDDTRTRAQYQQSMRAVISMVSREIRSTGADPTDAGIVGLVVADALTFRCQMDLNGDGDGTDQDPDESVTYIYDPGSGELTRNDGVDALVILRGLTTFQFRYYDENGTELTSTPLSSTDRDRVRFIQLDMAGEAEHYETVDYSSRIALRNI